MSKAETIQDPVIKKMEQGVLLRMRGIEKTFHQGGKPLTIFKDLSMKLEAGEIVALVGHSGSGKSTLLQIAGLLDKPTQGKMRIGDHIVQNLGDKERTRLRRDMIGFIYQFHHLLPEFSALENVALPQVIAGVKMKDGRAKAADLLESLGLGERLTHRPGQLSGGEQQRVAIARALANDPQILLADEPTGNLDPETSEAVFSILLDQVRKRNIAALIATHNHALAKSMDRTYTLKNGQLDII